jgi:glycosyltransferase involved in cell wall biosynthesis
MRLLHVATGNLFGGIETFLVTVARHAGPGRAEHRFAVCFDGRLGEELERAGASTSRLGPARLSRPWQVVRARRALARVVDEQRPTHVVFHGTWSWVALAPATRGRAVPVLWAHAPVADHWLDRAAMLSPPRRIVANSHYTARVTARTARRAEVAVVHCAVAPPGGPASDPGARRQVRAELGVPDGAFVFMTVGRMEAWKGHSLLLHALEALPARDGWASVIVGGPQNEREAAYYEGLEADVRRRGLEDRVRFAGQRDDVRRLLLAADVLCHPNERPEPFGIALVEAMYAGVPVVATRLGGPAEIVTPECGALVSPGDAAALARALGELAADPDRARRLGRAAAARAAQLCTPSAQLRALEEVLGRWSA